MVILELHSTRYYFALLTAGTSAAPRSLLPTRARDAVRQRDDEFLTQERHSDRYAKSARIHGDRG